MNKIAKRLGRIAAPVADVVLTPVVFLAALILKAIRRAGVANMPFSKRALMQAGVFPIRNHYFEPLFDGRLLRNPLDRERNLPGIDWNIDEQLRLLKSFCFGEELKTGRCPTFRPLRAAERANVGTSDELTFHFKNGSFESGDAEYFYNLIRFKKPSRIFEIGSGNSTLMAMRAIKKNREECPGYNCKHLCIEPYEMPWLGRTGATVIRQRVEELDKAMFSELGSDDMLFIDSSHVIRPQGDVLFEYLELLPSLRSGIIVHVHDIFSPRDYPKQWVVDEVRLWNEQYLLEAFLTGNRDWKIIGALNYLHHNYYRHLKAACPFLALEREPGSFYIQKIA